MSTRIFVDLKAFVKPAPHKPVPSRDDLGEHLPPRAHARGKRHDIQALRALAVLLVVLFHLWPKRMPGGYVGVDVFFVISGFLITSHLISAPPQTTRDVAAFWARRIRRLLPAALVTIAATALAAWAIVPESQWHALARDATASAVYLENWNLAGAATDYLASEGQPSPFQHFWSLSVEEQFYIVWPLVILAAFVVARSSGRSFRRVVAVAVGAVFAASLAASLVVTRISPAAAYFVTHTRMWELALGGLLALAIAARPGWFRWSSASRAIVAWVGIGLMGWAAMTFTGSTAFPGTAALVPTMGAAAFIAARSETGTWSPQRISRTAPVQFLGDVSYSVYLWHWPIIVVLPYVVGHPLHWPTKVAILATTIVIAWASKTWIEDPPQRSSRLTRPAWAGALAVAGMIGVTGIGGVQAAVASDREQKATAKLAAALASPQSCVGAQALAADADCADAPHGSELLVTPSHAALDRSSLYADGCFNDPPFDDRKTCTYGERVHPVARIALVGNSHAAQWVPTLQALAESHDWQITTYIASACITIDLPQSFKEAGAVEGCRDWSRWAVDESIKGDYDLVVTSARTSRPIAGVARKDALAAIRTSYRETLSQWSAADVPVLVLRDTPTSSEPVPDCVDQNLDDLSACDGARDRRLAADPLAEAALAMDDRSVRVADLTSYLCSKDTCYDTIGGLIAYFDRHHMTDSFARSLAPFVEPHVAGLLPPARR